MLQQKENNIDLNINMKTVKEKKKPLAALSGYNYQINLLMLFLWRGISQKHSFNLGAEIEEADKFDDLVLEYIVGVKKQFRLLQAKHSSDETKKITAKNLLTEPNSNYDLKKYFISYNNSKDKDLFKNGTIKDITICTNIGFNSDDLKKQGIEVEEIVDKDDILDIKSGEKQSVRYQFKECVCQILKTEFEKNTTDYSERGRKKTSYTDRDIKDFLRDLVFAVNQPNEKELGDIIQKEMGKEFDFNTTENVYNKLYQEIQTWLKDKNSKRFMSHKEGREFFDKVKMGFPIWFNMKDPVKLFTGRTLELVDLHNLLQSPDTAGTSPLVSITGVGGVGKTQSARQYCKQYAASYNNKVIWINAESNETLAKSFRTLSRDILGISTINVDNVEKDMTSVVAGVYTCMQISGGKSLFVFDNAEKYGGLNDGGIAQFLPRSSHPYNRPYVLITSRNQIWPKNIKKLDLKVFTEEEAKQFIKKSLNLEDDAQEEGIKNLAGELQCLPLALGQAMAYIRVSDKNRRYLGSKFEISNYLDAYKEKAKEYFEFDFSKDIDSDIDYTKTVFTTWKITLDMIKQKKGGKDAVDILYCISYFAPENIPARIFSKLIHDEIQLGSAIGLLHEYSMVNSENGMLNVHRLVQKVTRMGLKTKNREQEIVKTVLQLFNEDNTSNNMTHAMSVFFHSTKYNTLEEFSKLKGYIMKALMPGEGTTAEYIPETDTLQILRPTPEKVSTVKTDAGPIHGAVTTEEWYQQWIQDRAEKRRCFREKIVKIISSVSLPQTPAGGVGGKGSGSAGAGSGMVNGSGADHQDIRDGAAINPEHALVYRDGNLVSGSLEALVQHMVPTEEYYPDRAYLFAFLLSARLFIKPHELLGEVCALCEHQQNLNGEGGKERLQRFVPRLVQLLAEWTETFPYDFRDERVMGHVRSITQKVAAVDAAARQEVSALLQNLLLRLTALERYEEALSRLATEIATEQLTQVDITELCPSATVLAQQLTHVELERLSYIGPEEFVQAFAKESPHLETSFKDMKKTRNLESYVQWFNRLSYFVATEVCKHAKKKQRVRVVEYWIETARECFNIGNFNSLMAIIAGLNMSPISRLKKTWSKVQLAKFSILEHQMDPSSNFSSYRSTLKAAMWRSAGATDERQRIVVPFFSLLVKDLYFLNEGCSNKLPNGHINFEKFWQLAKQVTEFIAWKQVACPFEKNPRVIAFLQASPVLTENALALASFECEPPDNNAEKERYKALKSELNAQ